MTRDEKDYLVECISKITVEPLEPMNLEQIKAFVEGFEVAYLSTLDCIDKCYRDTKTD